MKPAVVAKVKAELANIRSWFTMDIGNIQLNTEKGYERIVDPFKVIFVSKAKFVSS